jgi:hypothetical protein
VGAVDRAAGAPAKLLQVGACWLLCMRVCIHCSSYAFLRSFSALHAQLLADTACCLVVLLLPAGTPAYPPRWWACTAVRWCGPM